MTGLKLLEVNGKVKATTSGQAALSKRGYMAELYEPYSVEFISSFSSAFAKVLQVVF